MKYGLDDIQTMAGHTAYYNANIYSGDTYNNLAFQDNQQSACIYAQNSPQGAFGGHTMTVVEQGLSNNDSPNGISHQLSHRGMPSPPTHGPMQNTTPAHVSTTHVNLNNLNGITPGSQPPPAHAHSSMPVGQPAAATQGQLGQNHTQQNSNLQFPWMKTTKSHAHQWKAQWPGLTF